MEHWGLGPAIGCLVCSSPPFDLDHNHRHNEEGPACEANDERPAPGSSPRSIRESEKAAGLGVDNGKKLNARSKALAGGDADMESGASSSSAAAAAAGEAPKPFTFKPSAIAGLKTSGSSDAPMQV